MGKHEGKRPLGSPDVDGTIILRWVFMKWNRGIDWIDLTQDRDSWRPLMNALIDLRFP